MIRHHFVGDGVTTYEEAVHLLVCDLGMKGKMSIDLFMGKEPWAHIPAASKRGYRNNFEQYDVPYAIYETRHRKQVLLLGADRVQLCMGLDLYEQAGKFNARLRNDYIMRLSEGRFPNPENQEELIYEMDLLMNPPNGIMDVL